MKIKIEIDSSNEVTLTTPDATVRRRDARAPLNDQVASPTPFFFPHIGDDEVDPGHLWIYELDGANLKLCAEIFVKADVNGNLVEHWYLFTSPGTHLIDNEPFVPFVWPSYTNEATKAKEVTMKFVYRNPNPKDANGTAILTGSGYHDYLKTNNLSHTYIVSQTAIVQ